MCLECLGNVGVFKFGCPYMACVDGSSLGVVRCTSHALWLVVGAFYHGKVVGFFIEDYAGY